MDALVPISLLSALLSAVCMAYVARRAAVASKHHAEAAHAFQRVLGLQIVYAMAFACEALSGSIGGKLFWDSVALAPTVTLPLALVAFAQRWMGGERRAGRVKRWGWFVLAVLPAAACVYVFSDPWHGLARFDEELVRRNGYSTLSYSFSTLEWLTFAELYALSLYGIGYTLTRAWRRPRPYRRQAAAVALAVSLPILASVPGMFLNIVLWGQRDALVVAFFAVGALVVTWALFRNRLFDLAPVPYDAVLDQLPLPVLIIDPQGRVADANPAAIETFDLAAGEIGAALDVAARGSASLARTLEALRAKDREVTLGKRTFELGESELRSADGPAGTLIKLHDVSERRRAEDEVAKARDALERRVLERTEELLRANQALLQEVEERRAAEDARERLQQRLEAAQRLEALGRLAGGVAHDFNNLLTVILGNTGLLLLEERSKEEKDLLADVQKAAQSAASLTQQLLAFARRQIVDPRVLDLSETVDGSERMLSRILGEDVQIRRVRGDDKLLVRVDPSQLEQVLINLSLNARDAMPSGGQLTITTMAAEKTPARPVGRERTPVPPPQGYAVLSVTDTGTGIDPELVDHVFEPFFTTKPLGKGTGLGLASVHGAVEQAGGVVSLDSELGKGSTVSIFFPRIDEKPAAAVPPKQAPLLASGTIALVEDQELVREVTRRQLELLGYRVIAFGSPLSALRELSLQLGEVDLLVSDVIMPEMSGPALVAELRGRCPRLPVLFLSGYAEEALADRGAAISGAPVLAKPFTPESLASAVQRAREPANIPPAD